MSYLARLKNLKGTDDHATKPTKLRQLGHEVGFVGFVAPISAPFENTQGTWTGVPANSANDPASQQPAPAAEPPNWKALDQAYMGHHLGCPACIAAGKGYGLRCGTGAALSAAYDAVDMPQPVRALPAAEKLEPLATYCPENSDEPAEQEAGRTAKRLALFSSRGLPPADAERLVEKLLTRDRDAFDRRGVCAECVNMRGTGPGRWQCGDRSPISINELAGAWLGAAFVHQHLHRCPSLRATK